MVRHRRGDRRLAKSKTLAERAAWQAAAGGAMEMVVINPGAVFGSALVAAIDGQSVALVTKMKAGPMPMSPDVALGMIGVREVARLHVKALKAPGG
ncbi:MAG: hypothetical protein ACK5N0_16245 [Synechococcaceae cyanobacterium]